MSVIATNNVDSKRFTRSYKLRDGISTEPHIIYPHIIYWSIYRRGRVIEAVALEGFMCDTQHKHGVVAAHINYFNRGL